MFIKTLTLIALLASVAWVARDPGWEPAITSIGLLISLIGIEIAEKKKSLRNTLNNADKVLFETFCKEFPSDGVTMRLLRERGYGDIFSLPELDDIIVFLDKWNSADHEFQNKELEKSRKHLYDIVRQYKSELMRNSFSLPTDTRIFSIGPKDVPLDDSRRATSEFLNGLGDSIIEEHQNLIRLGRRQLG